MSTGFRNGIATGFGVGMPESEEEQPAHSFRHLSAHQECGGLGRYLLYLGDWDVIRPSKQCGPSHSFFFCIPHYRLDRSPVCAVIHVCSPGLY